LAALLSGVMQARAELARPIPVFLKIAPDLSSDEIHEITQTAIEAGLSGIIATNTTLSREGLTSSHKGETGGLSGAPLFERSTRVLAQVSKAADGRIPIIGVGGVSSAQQALAKIRAGATAVQLYTAMVFQGLSLAGNIARDMDKTLQTDGIANIADIVGTDRDKWL
jgi:dihydroorotate dehydrogenase